MGESAQIGFKSKMDENFHPMIYITLYALADRPYRQKVLSKAYMVPEQHLENFHPRNNCVKLVKI